MYPPISTSAHNADVLSCIAPYGGGGLGQHFAQVVETTRRAHGRVLYYTPRAKPGDTANAVLIQDRLMPKLTRCTPLRFSPGGTNYLESERFDRAVAARLNGRPATFCGFGGQSLNSFRRATELGCTHLILLAANSHVDNVTRQHRRALARWPVERSWLNDAQRIKTLREYAMADEILIASDYSWNTFVNAGVPERKLRRIRYDVDPRFIRRQAAPDDGIFRIVYIGSITVMKGIPVLLEAFARLAIPDAELILVGGTASKGMRCYIDGWTRRDPRIKLAPGDPLPHLYRASACVHPSFEDNLAYAAVEAIATGVPVLCSDETGAREYVREGVNGSILPTGDVDALADWLAELATRRAL